MYKKVCYGFIKLDTFPFSSVFSIRIVFEFSEKKRIEWIWKMKEVI